MKRVIEQAGVMLGFGKLKVTAGIENTKNPPLWNA
jgi:hypothetical protein